MQYQYPQCGEIYMFANMALEITILKYHSLTGRRGYHEMVWKYHRLP
jgi:hypothetical protein